MRGYLSHTLWCSACWACPGRPGCQVGVSLPFIETCITGLSILLGDSCRLVRLSDRRRPNDWHPPSHPQRRIPTVSTYLLSLRVHQERGACRCRPSLSQLPVSSSSSIGSVESSPFSAQVLTCVSWTAPKPPRRLPLPSTLKLARTSASSPISRLLRPQARACLLTSPKCRPCLLVTATMRPAAISLPSCLLAIALRARTQRLAA